MSTLREATVIELAKLRGDPASFDWFPFRPGVKKLILGGSPESRHVSLLWYEQPGAVARHYHARTEAIYVIDGAQSDAQGTYARGTFVFNPPGSSHDVFDSAGLFLLAYAAPPDFAPPEQRGRYQPVVVRDASCEPLPLAADMRARFVRLEQPSVLSANILLVLEGSCSIAGRALAADTLVVTRSSEPVSYVVEPGAGCLLFELAFTGA